MDFVKDWTECDLHMLLKSMTIFSKTHNKNHLFINLFFFQNVILFLNEVKAHRQRPDRIYNLRIYIYLLIMAYVGSKA